MVGDTERAEVPVARLWTLPLFPAHLSEPAAQPLLELLERQDGVGKREVAGPSDREAVELLDPPLHRDAPVARGQLTDSILGSSKSLRSDRRADPAVPVAEELKPQEGSVDRGGDRRLLSVDAQLQALLDVLRDALHDALTRALA